MKTQQTGIGIGRVGRISLILQSKEDIYLGLRIKTLMQTCYRPMFYFSKETNFALASIFLNHPGNEDISKLPLVSTAQNGLALLIKKNFDFCCHKKLSNNEATLIFGTQKPECSNWSIVILL